MSGATSAVQHGLFRGSESTQPPDSDPKSSTRYEISPPGDRAAQTFRVFRAGTATAKNARTLACASIIIHPILVGVDAGHETDGVKGRG